MDITVLRLAIMRKRLEKNNTKFFKKNWSPCKRWGFFYVLFLGIGLLIIELRRYF